MSTVEITAGTVEPLEAYARAAAGGALTGSSNLRVQIRRIADGFFLDFNDSTFKSSGWTTRQATLAEIDATNAPGEYRRTNGVDTTGWSSGSYAVTFLEVSTSLVANGPQFATGEIRIVTATPSSLSARIPAALVSGRMDASVGAVASGAITAAAIADDAITAGKIAADAIGASELAADAANEIADALLDRALSGHTSSGTAGEALSRLDVATSTRLASGSYTAPPSAGDNATAVWGAGTRTLSGIGSSGIASQASVDAIGAAPSAASIADAVCDELLSGHTTSGSVGEALGRLDATVSSRLASASYSAPPSAAAIASQVWSTALPGAFSAGSGGYLVGTYLDAAVSSRLPTSSYAAAPSASAIATQVLGTAVPGAFGSGSLGYLIGTNLDVVLSTRLAAASYTAAPTASAVAAAVWATVEGTPSSGTFGYALWLLRMGLTNRLEEAAGNPGTLKLYADDGTTLLKTWQLRDGSGQAVTAQSGSPARRGAAT